MEIVTRIRAGEKVIALSEELGIHRKLLYEWVRRVNQGGELNLRQRGRPRKIENIPAEPAEKVPVGRLKELERIIAHQEEIIDFFRLALPLFDKLRHDNGNRIGATASFMPSNPRCTSGKAVTKAAV
jgi:transposase-like protein